MIEELKVLKERKLPNGYGVPPLVLLDIRYGKQNYEIRYTKFLNWSNGKSDGRALIEFSGIVPSHLRQDIDDIITKREGLKGKNPIFKHNTGEQDSNERETEPFFYNRKVYELTKLYDEGRLWKAIITADERGGHAEKGLRSAVKSVVLNSGSKGAELKGVEIEYRV